MGRWRRAALPPGLYDEVLDEHVRAALEQLDGELTAVHRELGQKEDVTAPLATLLHEALGLAFDEMKEKPSEAIALVDEVLDLLRKRAPRHFSRTRELRHIPRKLEAIVRGSPTKLNNPLGSLHASSLIVNAEGESLLDHIRSEFETADRVDLLCAFVKLSGFEKFRAAFENHCVNRARPLRVLTTTYMQATDLKAVERLASLPNVEVKVSFDEAATRLHAKAWVFHRASGYSTAFVGSSNLSHAAQTDGLEWNVRITESDQPALLAQMSETFEQYWADADQFELFNRHDESQRRRLAYALTRREDRHSSVLVEIEPKDFQKPVLAELMEARSLGRHRNLLVAATGTGKTVMAALDYRALRADADPTRRVDSLLYVAHRKEILNQARDVFRAVLQFRQFGELLFEGHSPIERRHVFASIDSLTETGPIDPAKFDMVIIDEAHHSAADSWTKLIARSRGAKELVGLTGTPERADGLDYAEHFPRPWIGNLRVWNAIPHALVPFRYYMLDVEGEGADLRNIAWRSGRYASEALAGKLVTAAEVFVKRAVDAIVEHVARPDSMRAIAFCADVRHAREVHARFERAGYNSRVLTSNTQDDERGRARDDLDTGGVQVLCVVDLYNEGVDLPNVNTLFFFRPTESATVFLQQLGRGLRRAPSKSELVVFDLTGRQHHEFRFDRKLRATTGHTPREVRELVESGFGRLPAGCHFQFDKVARQDVLDQLARSIPTDTRGIERLLREPAHAPLSLDRFLEETDVALSDLYARGLSWMLLRRRAGLDARPLSKQEEEALTNVHKLVHVGDRLRLDTWERLVNLQKPSSQRERRLARMLFVLLFGKADAADDELAWKKWNADSILREEIGALAPVLRAANALLSEAHELAPDVPLALHARYLGVELSAAFDHRTAKTGEFRDYYTGAEPVEKGRYDMLLVTLAKNAKAKEHLRYRDFPLNERRFHWQSKAATTRDEKKGRRHLRAQEEGCTPLLFVREQAKDERGATMAFRYLGPVDADGDEGERPITIEWRLRYAMPRDLLTNGRVAS